MLQFFKFLLLAATIFCEASLCLPGDAKKDAIWSADQQTFGEDSAGNQVLTLTGSVVMQQGSLEILADKMMVYYNTDSKVSKVVAIGQPARFSQTMRSGEEPTVAKARRMEYDPSSEILQLIDRASVVQQGASFTGHRIEIDIRRKFISAKKGEGERVRIVVPPEQAFERSSKEEPAER